MDGVTNEVNVISHARFILEVRGREEQNFNQWKAWKLRRPRNVTLHPKLSVQGTARRKNDVESTFVLCGSESAQFLSPLEFSSSPPSKVGLTQILEDLWAKILIDNQFLFLKIISGLQGVLF
jgi:hypothetical protein